MPHRLPHAPSTLIGMARIREYKRADGSTSYYVKWRLGGARTGKEQTETFDDEKKAIKFRKLVEINDHQWPEGWLKGHGFVVASPEPEEAGPTPPEFFFSNWAASYVAGLTGVDSKTRRDYLRLIDRLMVPWFGDLDVRDEEAFSDKRVGAWVNELQAGLRRPSDPEDPKKWTRRPYSPKYISNLHGLLFGIMQSAVDHRPPLRSYNPCAKTKLPRKDDHIEEEMVFLEADEFRVLLSYIPTEGADVAEFIAGTGMRWGEVSALQVRDLLDLDGKRPRVRIERAWKTDETENYFLGPPKTKKSRRTLGLNKRLVEIAKRNIDGKRTTDYVFTNKGGFWTRNAFYHRYWATAIVAAQANGFTKKPRMHDLRHTHVAWLIAKNVPLPAIQRRLGHESITTTIDRYGHLVESLEDDVMAALDEALAA